MHIYCVNIFIHTPVQCHLGSIQPCSLKEIQLCFRSLRKTLGRTIELFLLETMEPHCLLLSIKSTRDPSGSIWITTTKVSNMKSLRLFEESTSSAFVFTDFLWSFLGGYFCVRVLWQQQLCMWAHPGPANLPSLWHEVTGNSASCWKMQGVGLLARKYLPMHAFLRSTALFKPSAHLCTMGRDTLNGVVSPSYSLLPCWCPSEGGVCQNFGLTSLPSPYSVTFKTRPASGST